MAYNFLRGARSIHNSFLCMHDTLDGYSSDLHLNGDVDGWDIYNSIYLYGCWNGMLFGTTYDRTCYISRSVSIPGVEAEYYYVVKIMMKITDNNPIRTVDRLTTGRVQWTRIDDNTWNSTKQMDFDITADDEWRLYTINMGPMQWWQGDINNLRIYPFIDGKSGDEFAIKYIKISSQNRYACDNTQCSYYLSYEHPCPGGGNRGSCESGLQNVTYTTISGISDKFVVNIDGYGEEKFDLGTNENASPIEMSKILANKIASVSIGGYAYAQAEYSENDKLKIYSGTVGGLSSVGVIDSTGARALGFYDNDGNSIFTTEAGSDPVDGFDYASSRLMTALEINKLIDDKTDSFAYIHNPEQYNIEGGRRDFNEMGTSRLLSSISAGEYYESLSNKGKTLIDLSHPINNNGRIKSVYIYGVVSSLAKVKILRPKRDGTFTVIYSLDMPQEDDSKLYTSRPITYRVDCDVLVSRGDVIAIYNADIYVGVTVTSNPDASFQQILGDPDVGDVIDAGQVHSFGVAGFAIYARGDRWQNNVMLDIDLGDRINIEEMNIYGREESDEFEFNIASCLDLSWSVNLYGRSHKHSGIRWTDGWPWTHTHTNVAYGEECLDDCVVTADNGNAGDTLNSHAGTFSYFFVNGDAEWLYSTDCTGKTEYCWPYVPNSTYGFTRDPISFTMTFPYGFTTRIHKSIIYFKERNNFRSIESSYYMGPYSSDGNAYKDVRFQRIPNYTSIKLDGLEYLSDSGDLINDYIFNNPTNDEVQYATGGISDPINWEEYRASLMADWTILEHNFTSVECAGFRIYTNKHNSTKIMEIELYSKMTTSPSLLDNVSLSFSDYGDIWTDVLFEEVNDSKISGFMGGAPRYMRLEIESSTKFDLNELECLVGDQVKIEDCNDVILLDHAPSERVGDSTPVILENTYDKSFDLSVGIPREVSDSEDIIFWSKLGSETDIDDPQIGPGCKLYKSDDYPIGNDNGQCAISTPAYGLKNLIDDKNAYYNYYEDVWFSYDTLTSGVSIDYCNTDRINLKKSEFEFVCGMSAEHWKIEFDDASPAGSITDLIAYYDDVPLEIEEIYYSSRGGIYSQTNSITSDGISIDVTAWDDSFDGNDGDPPNSTLWTITTGGWRSVDPDIQNNKLHMDVQYESKQINSKFWLKNDFDIQVDWITPTMPSTSDWFAELQVRDASDDYDMIMRRYYISAHNIITYYKDGDPGWATCATVGYTTASGAFRITRSGTTMKSYYFNYTSGSWVQQCSQSLTTNDMYVQLFTCSSDNCPYADISFDNFKVNSGLISVDVCGFKLKNSQPVNKVKMFHTDSRLVDVAVYASPDNGDNYSQIASQVICTWNEVDKAAGISLSNYDLTAQTTLVNNWEAVRGNFYKSSGKWYWEITVDVAITTQTMIGIGTSSEILTYPGDTTEGYAYYGANGYKYHSSSAVYGATYTVGDVIGISLDLDNGKIWWSKNGVWQASGDPAAGTNAAYSGLTGNFYAMIGLYANGNTSTVNFGQSSFQYTIPSGFSCPYVLPALPVSVIANSQNYYSYFAIYLENRCNLDIIRNYGEADNKLFTSIGNDVEYSNSDTADVDSVVWDNSTYEDARWMSIKLLCGDDTTRCIRKLGIYPDIGTAYCLGGGYNCEWEPLGNILSDYYEPINIAYESVVSGTSMWYRDFYPSNVVDGISTDYREQACWGFDDSEGDPYLEMYFGQLYQINKVTLYHGYSPDDTDYMNVDYNFQVSTTVSGEDFTTVFSISGNSDFERTHQFTPVYARRARFTVTDYDHGKLLIVNPDTNQYEAFEGCFLREIEVYTYTDLGYINSEDWPIVCMNLKDQFQITNHSLVNKDPLDTDTDWDNNEDYFRYSDNHFDDPEKVAFRREGGEVEAYSTSDTSGNAETQSEYIFDEDIYFAAGFYNVEWQSYYNQSETEISLTFDGPGLVELYAESISTTWADESGVIEIPFDGFYTVKIDQHVNPENDWGGRNVYVYRMAGLTKWVSVKRDTAENYSWDNDSDKYGKDYLTLIKIFGDDKYVPTEYSWWWDSTVSTLDNDALIVKVGTKSLKILYPTYSGIDVVQFLEGDDFGEDVYFSANDSLHCWLYVDNVSRLDTTVGDITFGIINDAAPAYYSWYIENMSLTTGWNNVNLKFEDAEYTYPVGDDEDYLYGHLHEDLDFRLNDRNFTSFRLRYGGIGLPFNMYIDDLKIQRNRFDDDVRFGKGLCLSGQDYLDIPLAGITLERGAIEFWVKFYTDTYGIDIYGDMNSRTLFTMVNNNNDIISLGIKSGVWLEPNAGHVRKSLNLFTIDGNLLPPEYIFSIGDTAHIAVVWSNDGEYLDNKDTMRLYINGSLAAKSNVAWNVEDTKSAVIKLGGSNTQLALNKDTFSSAIFDNVKIYNYCKTNFNPNEEGISKDRVYTPNEFIEISSDNISFYGVGSAQLPLVFSQVPSKASRTIYIRTNKTSDFGRNKTTASVIISWLTTV